MTNHASPEKQSRVNSYYGEEEDVQRDINKQVFPIGCGGMSAFPIALPAPI